GILVLGQAQGSPGNDFDPQATFAGRLSSVDLFGQVLEEDETVHHMCGNPDATLPEPLAQIAPARDTADIYGTSWNLADYARPRTDGMWALRLNGQGSYAEATVRRWATSVLTMAFWLKLDPSEASHQILTYTQDEITPYMTIEVVGSSLKIRPTYHQSDPIAAQSLNDGRWHHLAIIWHNADGRVTTYIDGRNRHDIQREAFSSANMPETGTLYLGKPVEVDTLTFGGGSATSDPTWPTSCRGWLGPVAVWEKELSANRIQQAMWAAPDRDDPDLVFLIDHNSDTVNRIDTDWIPTDLVWPPRGAVAVPGLTFHGDGTRLAHVGVPDFGAEVLEATVAFYVRTTDINPNSTLFRVGDQAQGFTSLMRNALGARNGSDLTLFITEGEISTGVSIADGDLHHILFTWDNASQQVVLYVDGCERGH
ncbi:LamG-like jellyroll fold domain-containing protein, partial [Candidatus Entotheonella palauensis]|uniref:LamG-like jellyroll fold domain-containing protein n=1 Tax=Candidatus Entotheonella palauensis TaxID=93172 RepID=UPI001178A16F